MKFILLAAAAALASSAVATPTSWQNWGQPQQQNCLPQSKAVDIVNQYISILTHSNIQTANATAQALLANDYTEISDSILSLEGQPLGGVTFSGKQNYINGVLNAPPVAGVNTLEVLVAGCTKILWYWQFTGIGSKAYPIKGFNLFSLNAQNQVETVNLEFNSIAWGLDIGVQVILPGSTSATG